MFFAQRLKRRMSSYPVCRVRGLFKLFLPAVLPALLCLTASAQTTSNCTTAGTTAVQVASTGLAEKLGNIVLNCTLGNSGSSVIGQLFVTLNTNITNSLDVNGNPQNISISSTGAVVTATPAVLTSANTLEITNFSYTVPTPNSVPVNITISGIRAAVAPLIQSGSGTLVTASLFGIRSYPLRLSGECGDLGAATARLRSRTTVFLVSDLQCHQPRISRHLSTLELLLRPFV